MKSANTAANANLISRNLTKIYISIQIVASITERIASLLTVAETDELIVSVSTIVPSFIGYLAVTAFS